VLAPLLTKEGRPDGDCTSFFFCTQKILASELLISAHITTRRLVDPMND